MFYMKMFEKLNRKGFTLIELLAVIVILAVVMGVAATSVLSAMNNSRRSSLQNSALSAADGFRTKYAEYSMNPGGELMGIPAGTVTTLLNGTPQNLNVNTKVAKELNITSDNYDLANSYVYFDKSTSTFTVCLVAKSTGSYYVAAAIRTTQVAAADSPVKAILPANTMWACSDNSNSWT